MQVIGGDAAQHFVEIFARFPLRHGQIHQPEVAAIARRGAGHLTLERNNEFEGFDEQRHDLTSSEIIPLLIETYEFIAAFEGEVPGATARDCGNFRLMDLPMAQWEARKYLDEVLRNLTPDRLTYPD